MNLTSCWIETQKRPLCFQISSFTSSSKNKEDEKVRPSIINLSNTEHLLLIGDSIDRIITHQWCYKNNLKFYSWGEGTIRYGDDHTKQASFYCKRIIDNDSIAAVHIFSSKLYGPYYLVDSRNDPYVNTNVRVIKAIDLYINQFELPDKIVLNTELWDLRPFYARNHVFTRIEPEFNQTLKEWKNNLAAIIKLIRRKLKTHSKHNIELGLRTTAYYNEHNIGPLLEDYNKLIRSLVIERNLFLYDLDEVVWSTVDYNYSKHDDLFIDAAHPHGPFLVGTADKLLGNQYSANFQFHTNAATTITTTNTNSSYNMNNNNSKKESLSILCKVINPDVVYLIQQCPYFNFKIIRSTSNYTLDYYRDKNNTTRSYSISLNHTLYSTMNMNLNDLYFTARINNTLVRWYGVTLSLLEYFQLGSYDVYPIEQSIILKHIPLMNTNSSSINFTSNSISTSNIPYRLFTYDKIGIITTEQKYYVKIRRKIYTTTKYSNFKGFLHDSNNIILKDILPLWIIGCCDEQHYVIPNIYSDNLLLRCKDYPHIYVIKNATKHLIPNVDVFIKHGYDFSNVKILYGNPCEIHDMQSGIDLK